MKIKICLCLTISLIASTVSPKAQYVWYWANPKPAANSIYKVVEVRKGFLCAVGEGNSILTSQDLHTWKERMPAGSGVFRSVAVNKGNIVAVGYNGYMVLTDTSFVSVKTIKLPVQVDLYAVNFASDSVIVACGDGGIIIRSTDTGSTWQQTQSGKSSLLTTGAFVNDKVGVIAGIQGTILRTDDGAKSWNSANSVTTNDILDIETDSANNLGVDPKKWR